MTKFPLRTKRKLETRRKLVRAATHLFRTRGYEAVTLEEVAERAGMHVQTLYRHFATKQELASAGDTYWFNLFKEAIEDPERTTNTFEFWRDWMEQTVSTLTSDGNTALLSHLEMNHSSPTLLGVTLSIKMQYEDLLTKYLAKDFGLSPDGVGLPRLVVGMLMSANSYVRYRYYREQTDIMTETLKAIDMVTEMFEDNIVS